jgi:serine/threonine-protein kinase
MGFVFLGYHETEDRQVAIKVLADHLVSNQAFVERFCREAHSGSLLNHPNIVRTLSVGQDEGSGKHYLVLEYVDGVNARTVLEGSKRLAVGDAVHIALDIARALEHAHSRGIVHRDIKPDNILITRSGVAKLADMGLAKRVDETSHLTAARQGFGTPHYMPYEQAVNARRVDGRSDIYALGATLYHLVTGEVPFFAATHLEVIEKKGIGTFTPASVLNPEVPPVLDEILERMLARDPWDRYQTASELIIDLERSRLASPVLSFADPDLAQQDPYARSYLVESTEPTRMDLGADAVQEQGPVIQADVWFLRFRTPDGRYRKLRGTTDQILRRVRAGRLSRRVEACREEHGLFRPLSAFPIFRAALQSLRRKAATARSRLRSDRSPASLSPVLVFSRRLRWWLLRGSSIAVVLLAAVLVLYWLFLLAHS